MGKGVKRYASLLGTDPLPRDTFSELSCITGPPGSVSLVSFRHSTQGRSRTLFYIYLLTKSLSEGVEMRDVSGRLP